MRMGKMIWMLAAATALLSSGCADKDAVQYAERVLAAYDSQDAYANLPANVRLLYEYENQEDPLPVGKSDLLFMIHNAKHKKHDLEFLRRSFDERLKNEACTNRKLALAMARGLWSYKFPNYFYMDGVSGLIYNVTYLASVPAKALAGLRSSDGIFGYVGDLLKLLLGAIAAIIGIFAATIFNTICHPFQTIANLTIGLLYFDSGWWTYVTHTNIFASLWDLIWGGMIYPLWQALTFWL